MESMEGHEYPSEHPFLKQMAYGNLLGMTSPSKRASVTFMPSYQTSVLCDSTQERSTGYIAYWDRG